MKATALNLTENYRRSSFRSELWRRSINTRKTNGGGRRSPLPLSSMIETDENSRRYKWPWFVLAAVLLFVALAIVWMSFAVHRERQEHDFNAPLPSNPAH
jgi:hypothetical protein